MFSRNHFSELTDSLESGFFADRAILTLARAKRRGRLEQSELPVIDSVLQFLKGALEGSQWTEHPKFTTDSAAYAEAFSRASRALPDANSSELFKSYIQKLIETAQQIKVSDVISEDEVERLIQFFTRYGQAELERTDDLINPKDELRLGSWMSAKAFSGS
jgi:hypothetical protein